MNNIHIEICPYCNQKIEVSYGTRPCPKCNKLINIFPDDSIILRRMINVGIAELFTKLFTR